MSHNQGAFTAFVRRDNFNPTRYFKIVDFDPFESSIIAESFGGGSANATNQNIGGGVRRYTTGATNGQFAQYALRADVGRPNDNVVCEYRIRIAPTGVLTGHSATFYLADISQTLTDYAYFQFHQVASENWIAGNTSDGAIFTTTTTTTPVVANTWVTLRIELSSSNAMFFINDALVATHTTNLPTGTVALSPYVYQDKTSGAAVSHDVDYLKIWTTRLS